MDQNKHIALQICQDLLAEGIYFGVFRNWTEFFPFVLFISVSSVNASHQRGKLFRIYSASAGPSNLSVAGFVRT